MRIHILGLGSIGTLLGYHLRRNSQVPYDGSIPSTVRALLEDSPQLIRDYTLTLHLKSAHLAYTKFRKRGLIVTRGGYRGQVSSDEFRIEVPHVGTINLNNNTDPNQKKWPSLTSSREYQQDILGPTISSWLNSRSTNTLPHGPAIVHRNSLAYGRIHEEAIDTIIVTTKADSVLNSLRPLVQRLTPASTVVLLQNGMGVLDQVWENLWPDPSTRPHFILGNLTHGVYARDAFDVIHAGYGALRLGIVPSGMSDDTQYEIPYADGDYSSPLDVPSRRLLSNLNIDASLPTTNPKLTTLRATLLHLLALPLNVHWEPLVTYNVSALRKLAVNACINPTSAIYKMRNGELLNRDHTEIQSIWKAVCQEAADVFAAVAGRRNRPGEQEQAPVHHHKNHPFKAKDIPQTPYLSSSLYDARALLAEARSVARTTAENYSSMYIDVHGDGGRNVRASTEVQYMNGYISRLGKAHDVPTPVNDELVRRVTELRDQAQVRRSRARSSSSTKVQRRDGGERWEEEERHGDVV